MREIQNNWAMQLSENGSVFGNLIIWQPPLPEGIRVSHVVFIIDLLPEVEQRWFLNRVISVGQGG